MKSRVKKALIVSCALLALAFLLCASTLSPQPARTQGAKATITGLSQPFDVAVNPNGEYAYVTNGGSNEVSAINTTTNTVTAAVTVGTAPFGVAITPDGQYVYVTNGGSASVSIISTATNTVTGTVNVGIGPYGIAISPDGEYTYVTNFGTSTVSVISTAMNVVVATVPVGNSPQGIAVTPDGEYVYVADFGAGTVSVIGTASNTVVATVTVESGPIDVAVTPDGDYAYVVNSGSGSVSVIDTATNTVATRIAGFSQPSGVALTHNGAYAYVTNLSGDTVSVVSTATNTVVATVTVEVGPYGIALMPNDESAYVVNYNSASVSTINILPAVGVSPPFCTTNFGGSEVFAASPSGGSGAYLNYQWYINGSAQPNATASTYSFAPASDGVYSITVTVTDSTGATSAQSKPATLAVPWATAAPTPTPTPTPTAETLTTADHFPVPQNGGSISFAENGTYAKATFENNTWAFMDLRLNGSQPLSSFKVSAQNCSVTIDSFVVIQNSTFQDMRLKYTVENRGNQILNLVFNPQGGESNPQGEWSVVNNNVSLVQGTAWTVSPDGAITVKGVIGDVTIELHSVADFFGNGEAYSNVPFYQQHSVGITMGAALVIVLVIAVLAKVKTRGQRGTVQA